MLRKLGIVAAVVALGLAGAALAVAGVGSGASVQAVEGQGFTTPVATYTSALTGNQRFVYLLYEDLLGRAPTNTELVASTNVLDGGFVSRADVARGLLQSSEYLGTVVDSVYQSYLNRSPSLVERSLGIGFLGLSTDEQFKASILGSAEFFNAHGGTVDGFLIALFEDVLGRGINPTEQTFYEGLISGGATEQDVALDVLTSTEAREDLVQSYFRHFLHHDADPSALSFYVGLLGGGSTDENVIATIVGGDEYFANTQVSSAVINWGDSSPTDTVTFTVSGTNTFGGSHTYSEENTYPLGVTVNDIDGTFTISGTATVTDAALSASPESFSVPKRTLFTQTVATFTDANPGATTADFTATIDWGDGSVATGTVSSVRGAGFAVTGAHEYKKKGSYSVGVQIADDGGSSATATTTIDVTPHG